MDGSYAHGEVATLVHESVYSEEIVPNSALQAISARIILQHLNFKVCSLYLPPGDNISPTDLSDLFPELPIPFILLVILMPPTPCRALLKLVRETNFSNNSLFQTFKLFSFMWYH